MKLFWLGTLVSTILTMVLGCLGVAGSEVFTSDFWSGRVRAVGLVCLPGFLVAAFVAFAVVSYYKRIAKKDAIRVA